MSVYRLIKKLRVKSPDELHLEVHTQSGRTYRGKLSPLENYEEGFIALVAEDGVTTEYIISDKIEKVRVCQPLSTSQTPSSTKSFRVNAPRALPPGSLS